MQTACLEKLYDYNATRPSEAEKRQNLLKEMFAEIGEGCYIEPPFHANWTIRIFMWETALCSDRT